MHLLQLALFEQGFVSYDRIQKQPLKQWAIFKLVYKARPADRMRPMTPFITYHYVTYKQDLW
jgi:hypothetical protein